MKLEDIVGGIVKDVTAVLVFSPDSTLYDTLESAEVETVVVAQGSDDVELPLEFEKFEDRIRYGIEGAMENEFVEAGDYVLCVDEVFNNDPDTYTRLKVTESFHTGLYNLFMSSKADPSVIRDVIQLSIELGKKGQKGKPICALFVVGDAGKVMEKSRELSYNPFEKSHVHVGDPIVNVMLKEFSRLDGAFIISDSGKIVSAYRYLEADAEGIDIPKGLGTRHVAGAAITRDTNAISVVLSESDRMVRVFKGGNLVLELDPEEY
ncbi:MAG: diadenylate cyclase domain-containing protein [Halobacteria archaeon]|nr:diadenylate cyclase domain-containing protein [Halobacteria archaeon]